MERYNPVVRERQRQHIQELLQEDVHKLFLHMDERIDNNISRSDLTEDFILWMIYQFKDNPYPKLTLGVYSWRFYVYMRRLQPRLCKEWHFCEEVRNPKNSDRVELAIKLADFLVEKGLRRAGIDTTAVALLSIDPKDLCGCEDNEQLT